MSSKVIVALDYHDAQSAKQFVDRVTPEACALKVGLELFTAAGPRFVESLVARDFKIFLDLKFFDIPNTVAKACAAAAQLGVWMVNVHALGGTRMMAAAREAIDKATHQPLLIGVTVLTSATMEDTVEMGLAGTVASQVQRLAQLTEAAGLDGVVCSPHELQALRSQFGNDFCLVTPGIRQLEQSPANDDQRRTMTPKDAMAAGASYLVIGRPITQAADPIKVLSEINLAINY